MTTPGYPFDPTGQASSNYIQDEQHTVTESNFRDYFFIVPECAPFFPFNFTLKLLTTEGFVTLNEGMDYNFALPYVGATRSIGSPVYGAITLVNLRTSGTIGISYQTLGGEWVADRLYVLEQLAEKVYNPRITIWDAITDKTNTFPPINHHLDIENTKGQDALIDAIIQLSNTIATYRDQTGIVRHLTNYNNPHQVTLEQLGIPLLGNWGLATVPEALAGSAQDRLITPFSLAAVKASIDTGYGELNLELSNNRQSLFNHLNDRINPHQVTKNQVGLGQITDLPLADDSEIINREHVEKYITLRQLLILLENYDFTWQGQVGYNLNVSNTTVAEGAALVVDVVTPSLPDNTVLFWTIAHQTTTESDFIHSSGEVVIVGNAGQFMIQTVPDVVYEGTESFTVRLRSGSVAGSVLAVTPTIALANVISSANMLLSVSSRTPVEGQTVTVFVSTEGVLDETRYYWTIGHITTQISDFSAVGGSFVIMGNNAQFDVIIANDLANEMDESFTVQIRVGSISGPVIAETSVMTILAFGTVLDYMNACCLYNPRIKINPASYFIIPSL